jgi:hypothetical protein
MAAKSSNFLNGFFQRFKSGNYSALHFLNLFCCIIGLWMMQFIFCCVIESFPAFEKQPLLPASYQVFQPHGGINQFGSTVSPKPEKFFFCCAFDKFFNQWENSIFDLQFFGFNLGTQSPAITNPTRNDSRDEPIKREHNVLLKAIAWWGCELSNHLWLWILGPILSMIICYLFGRFYIHARCR